MMMMDERQTTIPFLFQSRACHLDSPLRSLWCWLQLTLGATCDLWG